MSIKIAFSFHRKLFAQAMPSQLSTLTASNTAVLQARCVYQDSQFVLLDSKSNKLKTVFDSKNFPLFIVYSCKMLIYILWLKQ